MIYRFVSLSVFLPIVLCLSGCLTMALHDQHAYRSTIDLKVEALSLMEKGTKDFSEYEDRVEVVMNETQKLYEYERGREKNELTIRMWEVLLNPEKNLLAGFMGKWENEDQLSSFLVSQSSEQVEQAFDLIIGLELEKIKKEEVHQFLNR